MCRQNRREYSRVISPNGRSAAFQRTVMELRLRRLHLMTLVLFLVVPALISCNTGQTPATPHIPPSATVIPTVAPQSATPAPPISGYDVLAECIQDIDVSTHFHVQLTITLHGSILPIPPGIGIEIGCINRMHTHAGSGVWFNVIWVTSDAKAGHPGYDGSGLIRPWNAVGLCGATSDDQSDGVCN